MVARGSQNCWLSNASENHPVEVLFIMAARLGFEERCVISAMIGADASAVQTAVGNRVLLRQSRQRCGLLVVESESWRPSWP